MRSKYGLKIKNVQVATLFECNAGLRYKYETTDAMLNNSLFLDAMIDNIKVESDGSTKDFICCQFAFGCKTYEQRRKEIVKKISTIESDIKNNNGDVVRLKDLLDKAKRSLEFCDSNKDKYIGMSKEDLRKHSYVNGVYIDYYKRKRDGSEVTERIYYKMLYRSTGKAKIGECIFCNAKIWEACHNYLYCGRELAPRDKIVELSAYVSLAASTIVDRITIRPEQILILPDVDRSIRKTVLDVTSSDGKAEITLRENFEVPSVLFDGEGILDESIFPSDRHQGYVLLRNFFFKAACFRGDVQSFYRDKLGEAYESATVTDAFGNTIRLKDVRLVTTTNALKIKKINVSYETWKENVEKYNCTFGIVKSAHPSKLGNYQRMSYQMVNSLNINNMGEVMQDSVEYVERLKNDDGFYLEFLKRTENYMNDNEALLSIVNKNPSFINSSYFRDRRSRNIRSLVQDIRGGKVLQSGAVNATIVSNPYGLLLHSLGINPDEDVTLPVRNDNGISCYCTKFKHGEMVAGFRSPFNSKNNLLYLVNNVSDEMEKYFSHFTDEIVAVNSRGTDVQSRGNGL